MQSPTKILCFAGSTRAASFNRRLAQAAANAARLAGATVTLVDLADYPMPLYDGDLETRDGPPESARRLMIAVAGHGGMFIASPEYNASISPLLKNSLDWVSRIRDTGIASLPTGLEVMKTRVVALGAASPGGTGGIRGLIAVRYMLEMGIGAMVLPDQVLVPRANSAFADDGTLTDKDAADRLTATMAKLVTITAKLEPVTV